MRTVRSAATVIVALAAFALPAVATGQDFKVVVNASNSTTEISKADLSKCFMKQASTWISGQQIAPVDQAADSEVRKAFSEAIHKRDVGAVKSFWQRQIFSGRGVPPPEKASDQEVLAFVRSNPGGVGYVSPGTQLGSGLKELKVLEE